MIYLFYALLSAFWFSCGYIAFRLDWGWMKRGYAKAGVFDEKKFMCSKNFVAFLTIPLGFISLADTLISGDYKKYR